VVPRTLIVENMRRLRQTLPLRRGLLALYVLAVATLGFAHRVPVAPAVDLSAYALPDGTIPVICGTVGERGGTPGGHHARAACEACLLTAAPGLLVADGIDVPLPQWRPTERLSPGEVAQAISRRPANVRSRSPPTVIA